MRCVRAFLLLAVPALVLLRAPAAGDADEKPPVDFKAAEAAYDAWQKRPSLYMRHKGRVEFAQTGDVRAFSILAKSYARPEDPKDQVRYLLASICGEHFRKPEHLDTWRAWRRRHGSARDAWLWFQGLAVEAEAGADTTAALDVARGHGNGVLRAAALATLIERKDPVVLTALAHALADLPAKGFDRMLLLESAAEALLALHAQRKTDAWAQVHGLLMQQLDARPTQDRTRRVVARRLLRLGAIDAARAAGYLATQRARFFGLEATGSRIVYVIDLSDSMLSNLTRGELKDLQTPPAGATEAQIEALKKLPWYDIDTRFDAAMALLKHSLRGLTPEKQFCVIVFGSEARTLDATRGLKDATQKNIEKACRELDAIERGEATRDRPQGTLGGYTNLHGGLHRAFKLRGKGLTKDGEYVDPKTFAEGCDTLFLFSDGKPTWDDWPAWDIRLAKHQSGDPESGRRVRDHEKGHYYGPYALASWLRDDLRRLNLFRKVEIHCVGLGEHDPHLLRFIAGQGLGRTRNIPPRAPAKGKDAKRKAAPRKK